MNFQFYLFLKNDDCDHMQEAEEFKSCRYLRCVLKEKKKEKKKGLF